VKLLIFGGGFFILLAERGVVDGITYFYLLKSATQVY
jgi:hypothetical protein